MYVPVGGLPFKESTKEKAPLDSEILGNSRQATG
jgi:hypothetical protein